MENTNNTTSSTGELPDLTRIVAYDVWDKEQTGLIALNRIIAVIPMDGTEKRNECFQIVLDNGAVVKASVDWGECVMEHLCKSMALKN